VIVDGREQVEGEIEDAAGVAFVPRGYRAVLDGNGRTSLFLPHNRITRLVSLKVGDDTVDVADAYLYGSEGRLALQVGSFGTGNLTVQALYEHGYAQPPARIKRAALILLKDRVVASNIEDRALSHTDEAGTIALSVAGANGIFGIPEVDAAVEQYSELAPRVG